MSGVVALNLGGGRRVPMVHQDEAAECGLACLAMVAGYYGHRIDLISLRSRFGVSIKGMTLRTLLRVAEDLQLDARPLRAEVADLSNLRLPAILHWGFNHFVVLTAIKRRGRSLRYRLHDPASGECELAADDLSKSFTGVVVELTPTIAFTPRQERSRLSVWQLWSRAPGLGSAAIRILLLSIMIELFALAAPFYLQIAIDTVAPAHDLDLLTALALGFGAVAILSQVTGFVRSWAVVSLSNELGYRLVSNLFRHMVRLPIGWFQRRSVGDVLTRFNASQPITDLLSSGLIPALVDGVMALVTVALMLVYSPMLTLVSLGALLTYIALRALYFGVLKARNIGAIQAQAREQAVLIETIRGITPIRLFGRELDRARVWQNRRVELVNAQISIARMQAIFSTANSSVVGIENILFVYLAIRMNLAGTLTIGMITAFSAYKQQFLSAALNVVTRIIDYRMLDVQLGRIGDIALNKTDPAAVSPIVAPIGTLGRIEVRDICFRYAPGEPEILSGVSFAIELGETLAIIGPSGGGKTTLLKILLGLMEPTRGEILVDGRPLTQSALAEHRGRVGAVMQDDTLFAGSLAENIAFFDPQHDLDRVKQVARLACIDQDIEAMPMAYESLVGDMGSALSGGQKQRVLLARALYRQPELLVVDEGTANLDIATEARVSASLRALNITRVIVAHRPETIASADRQLVLMSGRVQELE